MWYTLVETSIGPLWVAWTERGIACLSGEERDAESFLARCRAYTGVTPLRSDERQAVFQEDLQRWMDGIPYQGPIDLSRCSAFAQQVLAACRAIPRGETRSYADLARAVGKPGAARAVGTAMRRNPVPLLIPCHRVVRGDGVIGNYNMGGPEVKRRLLQMEGAGPR